MSLIAADVLAIGADVLTFGGAVSATGAVQLGVQPAQPPPQAQRNDCADCYTGRAHAHDGSSSLNGAPERVMASSDPAHAYACGAATGVGFVGARQNDGVTFVVDSSSRIIARATRHGITTFHDTGLLSNAQPGSYARHPAALLAARTPQVAGPVPPHRGLGGGTHDPRRVSGNQGPALANQPDSRQARGLAGFIRVNFLGLSA